MTSVVIHFVGGFMAFDARRVTSIVLTQRRVTVRIAGQTEALFVDFDTGEEARERAVEIAAACGFTVETPP